MSSSDRQQRRIEALRIESDRRIEKLKRLRKEYAIVRDVAYSFQLEKEIESEEKQCDRLNRKLTYLEASCRSDRIYNALLSLNYKEQVLSFNDFCQQQRVGAFLIHGELEHGQIWLIHRLLRSLPEQCENRPIQFDLYRRTSRSRVEDLWRYLGCEINAERNATKEAIANRVRERLQTQHVVLAFHNIDRTSGSYLQELLREFWLPLVEESVGASSRFQSDYFLLMFLIDNDACVKTWEVTFAWELGSSWQPNTPIALPAIESFSDDMLLKWIEHEINSLLPRLDPRDRTVVQQLLERSDNGVPERVFREIYELFECDLYGEERRWMQL